MHLLELYMKVQLLEEGGESWWSDLSFLAQAVFDDESYDSVGWQEEDEEICGPFCCELYHDISEDPFLHSLMNCH